VHIAIQKLCIHACARRKEREDTYDDDLVLTCDIDIGVGVSVSSISVVRVKVLVIDDTVLSFVFIHSFLHFWRLSLFLLALIV